MTIYVLDTDVLIRAKNEHYGFDLCPGFWQWLDHEHAAHKVFSVRRVYDEILDGEDELSEWAKQRRGFFLEPDQSTIASLAEVGEWADAEYTQTAVTAFMKKADYFLVAQAHAWGYAVVTYEVPAPDSLKSIKIPDACDAVGVDWFAPHEMLRSEGARFDLRP